MNNKLSWEKDIKVLSDNYIMVTLLKVFGLSFGIMALIVFLITAFEGSLDFETFLKFTKGFVLIFIVMMLLSLLGILVVMGNKYSVIFTMNDKKVFMDSKPKQKKKNFIVATLLIILGIFSKNPTAVGTGLINKNNNYCEVKWKDVKKIIFYNKKTSVLIKGSFPEKVYLVCDNDNYTSIKEFIINAIESKQVIELINKK